MKKLLMFMIAGTMVFGACKKDEDPVPTTPADTTAPTISVTSPTDAQVITAGDMLTISGKAMDNSNLKSFSVKTEFSSVVLKDSVTTISGKEHSFTQSVPTTGWPAGEYTFTFTSTDAANNVSAATVVKVTVKAAGPVDSESPKINSIAVTLPFNGKLNSNFTNEITLDVTDDMELASIKIEIYHVKNSNIIATANATITDPKSFKGVVKVAIPNMNVLNDAAEIRVKATDKSGKVTDKMQTAVLEF